MVSEDERVRLFAHAARQVSNRFRIVLALNILIVLFIGVFFVLGFAISYASDSANISWFFTSRGLSFIAFVLAGSGAIVPYLEKWNLLNLCDINVYQNANKMNMDNGKLHKERHERIIRLTGSLAFVIAGGILQAISLWLDRG